MYYRYRKLDNKPSFYSVLAKIAVFLAVMVIMLGAYTRLKEAGLGCPDWPGCYGRMVLPSAAPALEAAQKVYPNIPIEPAKAWAEMVHRYFAGTLGMLLWVLAIWGMARRKHHPEQPVVLPWLLIALGGFQAVLGMWTVTLKLLPLVVTGHLLGGMAIASCLLWVALKTSPSPSPVSSECAALKPWIIGGLIILAVQIFAGAWTSTNYAALACPEFPFCQGTLFPPMHWQEAFNLLNPIGPNYEGGRLALAARVTIQMAHRYGAFITFLFFVPLSCVMISRARYHAVRKLGWALLILLAIQITLGIVNVVALLPLSNAVLHNGVAAILLLTVVATLYRCSRRE